VRDDPGGVLLLVRQSTATRAASGWTFFPALLRDPAVLEGAAHFLEQPPAGFIDWNQEAVRPLHRAALSCARLAALVAERTGRCDPDNAWVAGLLAPLGWMAVAAVAPEQVAACLADPAFAGQPKATQRHYWGLDHTGIARRLCRRWQVPRWLAVVVSYLGLPAEAAQALGAELDLFRVVQLAVVLVPPGAGLGLAAGATPAQAAAALDLPAVEVEDIRAAFPQITAEIDNQKLKIDNPQNVPLLSDLLRLAAENRALLNPVALERLEGDVDGLHQALEQRIAGETQRLQDQKLSALAEFAAGAGHEINNPLAVISGQAQYLLRALDSEEQGRRPKAEGNEEPHGNKAKGEGSLEPRPTTHWPLPTVTKALQTIIGQTKRIHSLLSDLMQFARPPRPRKVAVDVPALVREVAASLQDLAAQRQVRLACPDFGPAASVNGEAGHGENGNGQAPLTIYADPQQVCTALSCLVRNAIEAAPAEGWARIRLETPSADRLELVVEDNGQGPPLPQREHLFDLFYSGRSAGRGRGLGLATAWRLAREHGGDVRFEALPGEPTRFVLSLPRPIGTNGVGH
jgi:signal transduction histidine kinase